MRSLRSITATKFFALGCLALAGLVGQAQAEMAGRVVNISGPLFAIKADNSRRVLSVGANVENGDTLLTEARTYARIKFSDGGEVTLRPGSQFKVDSYRFEQGAPKEDRASFNLLKGAMRTVTGLIGKRGNQDAYRMATPTATIGIRGTTYDAIICPGPACTPSMPPGTIVGVLSGEVAVSPPPPPPPPPGAPPLPPQTQIRLAAGTFGVVPPAGPPQQLPSDPGVSRGFNPPPAFQQPTPTPVPGQNEPVNRTPQQNPAPDQDNSQGCVVR